MGLGATVQETKERFPTETRRQRMYYRDVQRVQRYIMRVGANAPYTVAYRSLFRAVVRSGKRYRA